MDISNDSCNHSISDEIRRKVLIAFTSSGLISAVACITAILLMICFCMHKQLIHRLMLYLLFSALFFSISIVIQLSGLRQDYWKGVHYEWCIAEGFLILYSLWVMLLSTLNITIHLTIMVIFYMHYKKLSKLEPFYILFPWLFPLLFTWIPFINDTYGIAGPWCWIKLYNNHYDLTEIGTIEEYSLWYGEFFVLLIINTFTIITVITVLCKRAYTGDQQIGMSYNKALKQTLPLIAFPILYQIQSWTTLTDRTYQLMKLSNNSLILWIVPAILSSGWGFLASCTTIIYLGCIGKFTKYNPKKVVGCCTTCLETKVNVIESEQQHLLDPEDGLTNAAYSTVTAPTSFHPPNESSVDGMNSIA